VSATADRARHWKDTDGEAHRVPLSTSFGRRPVYIVSQLICFGSSIWRAKATTYNSFMGACILNGIGAGPAETIQPAVIADIFFLHDRGFWNTLYWVCHLQRNHVGSFVTIGSLDTRRSSNGRVQTLAFANRSCRDTTAELMAILSAT